MIDPFAYTRRSPLIHRLANPATLWRALADVAYADEIGGDTALPPIAVADLSALPRIGFKGRGALAAMETRGIQLEPVPNRCFRQADGSLCLVLAKSEVILLSPFDGSADNVPQAYDGWSFNDEERTYPLPRRDSHAWLAVTGAAAAEMFAKLCAIDLRIDKFPDLAIAQTSIARMNAIVARTDVGAVPVFHLLVDSAAAQYFCDCILDAAEEFGGRLVGLGALRKLASV